MSPNLERAFLRLKAWRLCLESEPLTEPVKSHLNDLYLILLDILEDLK